MKIGVVHNSRRTGIICRFGQPCPETYGAKTIQRVVEALGRMGHAVGLFEGDKTLVAALEEFMPPLDNHPGGLVMNMAYGIQGNARYTHVPAMLEMAGVPYTGAGPTGHALALDKVVTKDVIRCAGVPTPAYTVMRAPSDPCRLRFPLIVKPRHESTSFGLRLVGSRFELEEAVEAVTSTYLQDALVEEYLPGREFCVALLGNDRVWSLPVVEQDFGDRDIRLLTNSDKYHRTVREPVKRCPAPIEDSLRQRLVDMSVATFRACQLHDYARVDIRLDGGGEPYVLEINSMTSLGPGGSYVCAAAAAGLDYDALVGRIVDEAHVRYFGVRAPAGAAEVADAAAILAPAAGVVT